VLRISRTTLQFSISILWCNDVRNRWI